MNATTVTTTTQYYNTGFISEGRKIRILFMEIRCASREITKQTA